MFLVVRPLLRAAGAALASADAGCRGGGRRRCSSALLLSALATEAIGIHALFGAFLLGAVIPHDSRRRPRASPHKLEDLVTVLLLPAFFAFTGMRTQIGLVSGVGALADVRRDHRGGDASGKFGGTLAAGAADRAWPGATSAALGVLMNTRGLMELIVLNIGLDLGVISPTLFAMMVLMALVTTMATTPVLQFLYPADMLASGHPGFAGGAGPGWFGGRAGGTGTISRSDFGLGRGMLSRKRHIGKLFRPCSYLAWTGAASPPTHPPARQSS